MVKKWLDKFKENPIKIIGLTLTNLGVLVVLVPVLLNNITTIDPPKWIVYVFLILIIVGSILLLIGLIIKRELIKESDKIVKIGLGGLVLSALGMIIILMWISLALIGIGIVLSAIKLIKKKNGLEI